jgi:hypothetical protein
MRLLKVAIPLPFGFLEQEIFSRNWVPYSAYQLFTAVQRMKVCLYANKHRNPPEFTITNINVSTIDIYYKSCYITNNLLFYIVQLLMNSVYKKILTCYIFQFLRYGFSEVLNHSLRNWVRHGTCMYEFDRPQELVLGSSLSRYRIRCGCVLWRKFLCLLSVCMWYVQFSSYT